MRKVMSLILFISLIVPFTATGRLVSAQLPAKSLQSSSRPVPTGSEKIAPQTQAALASLQNGEMTSVIITLTDQADLSQIPSATRAARQKGVIIALQAKAEASQRALKALLAIRQAQGQVSQIDYFWVFNGLAVTATSDVIQEVAARADVQQITPNDIQIETVSSSVLAPSETNLSVVSAPALWDLGLYGQGVVVANMDTGVDVNHPDLAGRWRGGANSWLDPYGQHPTAPTDLSGHGTWAMGVMVGGDAGGSFIGVAPQAQWIAVKIFDDAGSATASAIHQGFQWLLDPDGDPNTPDAPHVVNNSWTFAYPGCDLEFQLDMQSLRAAGVLSVFAAGNGGPDAGTSYSPSNNPAAFAVGGTDNSDNMYAYSSRGPSSCGEATTIYPEVVAPAVGIRTADLQGLYSQATGTSLAAPHVSGGLALLLSAYPDLTDVQQESALRNSAIDLGIPGPDNDYGYGRLDVFAAYQWLNSSPPPTPTPTATPDPTINLALNQPVTVSSLQDGSHDGNAAVDGDLGTFWKTQKASGKGKLPSEWIVVDLGSGGSIGKVVLEWDSNYATNYSIQVSEDNNTWTTVHSTVTGDGGNDTIPFNSISARYVMLESTVWSNGSLRSWLREFEIYADSGGPSPTATPTPAPTLTPTPGSGTTMHVGDLDGASNPGNGNRWDATVTITVHDVSENPVVGATVNGSWSNGASGSGSCVTDDTGGCSITRSNVKGNQGSVTFTVDTVSHTSMTYQSSANHDPDGDSNGIGITVSKP